MEELAIGEVARRAGIRPSALRYYESIGLLPAPRRVNGQRRYDERTVQLLKIVRLAQHAGFTVAEIQVLLHGFAPDTPPAARWQPLAQQKIAEFGCADGTRSANEVYPRARSELWLSTP